MTHTQPLVVANWKMQKRTGEAFQYVAELEKLLEGPGGAGGLLDHVEVVFAPPFTLLWMLRTVLGPPGTGGRFALAGQDVHWADSGAYTGAIAASQLADLGCRYVLIGHSERRRHFGETPEMTGKKAHCAVAAGLRPILCVGETWEERERKATRSVVEQQVGEGLRLLAEEERVMITIAYEPVWAIGTGRTATPAQAAEVHQVIREQVARRQEPIRVLYGGSVTPDVVPALMAESEIDGLLVGGASLDATTFARIIQAVQEARG